MARPRKKDALKAPEALLDAAREIVLARGFKALTTREVARHAATTPAMIHYYYGGRQCLCHTLLQELLAPFVEHLERLSASDTFDIFIAECGSLLALMQTQPRMMHLLAAELLQVVPGPLGKEIASSFIHPLHQILIQQLKTFSHTPSQAIDLLLPYMLLPLLQPLGILTITPSLPQWLKVQLDSLKK